MSEENEYPVAQGNEGGTTIGYKVMARYCGNDPKEIAGQIFDERWRVVQFEEGQIGVPSVSPLHARHLLRYNLKGYSAAQALRWWLHAVADNTEIGMSGMMLETKLVKHKIEFESKCEAISEHKIISGEDRSSWMPDYGENN